MNLYTYLQSALQGHRHHRHNVHLRWGLSWTRMPSCERILRREFLFCILDCHTGFGHTPGKSSHNDEPKPDVSQWTFNQFSSAHSCSRHDVTGDNSWTRLQTSFFTLVPTFKESGYCEQTLHQRTAHKFYQ